MVKLVPVVDIWYVAPATVTATRPGAHPALSRYLTEKENVCDVEPDAGVTVPLLSVIVCLGLEQLAACATVAQAIQTTAAASRVARRAAVIGCQPQRADPVVGPATLAARSPRSDSRLVPRRARRA